MNFEITRKICCCAVALAGVACVDAAPFRIGTLVNLVHQGEYEGVPGQLTDTGWSFSEYQLCNDAGTNRIFDLGELERLYRELPNLDMVIYSPIAPLVMKEALENEAHSTAWVDFLKRGGVIALPDAQNANVDDNDQIWHKWLVKNLGEDYALPILPYDESHKRPNFVIDPPDAVEHPPVPFRHFPSELMDGMMVWGNLATAAWKGEGRQKIGIGPAWTWVDDFADKTGIEPGPLSAMSHFGKGLLFVTCSRKPYVSFFENLRADVELNRAGLKVVRGVTAAFSNKCEAVDFTIASTDGTAVDPADYQVEVVAAGEDGTSCSANARGTAVADGLRFAFTFVNTVVGKGTIRMTLRRTSDAAEITLVDRRQAFEHPIEIILPRYHGLVSTCRRQTAVRLGFRINPADVPLDGGAWTATVANEAGNAIWSKAGTLADGEREVVFWADIPRSTPQGWYNLTVTFPNAGDNGVSRTDAFRIMGLPTKPGWGKRWMNQTVVDQDNVLLKDGKPWFPIGLYGTQGGDRQRIWRLGFNLQHSLDRAMGDPRKPFSDLLEMNQPLLFEWNKDQKTDYWFNRWIFDHGDPNCIYRSMMYIADECTDDSVPYFRMCYESMLNLMLTDSEHGWKNIEQPVYFTSFYRANLPYLAQIGDIIAADDYSGNLAVMPDYIDFIRRELNDTKPIFAVINVHGNSSTEEMRLRAFLAIAHGVNGLMWYEWGQFRGSATMEAFFPKLISEIHRVDPFIVSLRRVPMRLANGAVHALDCGDDTTGRRLICVNPTESAVEVTECVPGFAAPFTVPARDVVVLEEVNPESSAVELADHRLVDDGETTWAVDSSVSKVGGTSLRSPSRQDGSSTISLRTFGAGTVAFWWRTTATGNAAHVFVDGNVQSARPTDEWTRVTVAVNGEGEHIVSWAVDGAGGAADEFLWLDLVQWVASDGLAKTSRTPVPVPYGWLSKYGLASECDFETAAAKLTAKGTYVWQEYLADTDPTKADSRLRAFIEMRDGVPEITFEPRQADGYDDAQRFYSVLGRERLDVGEWEPMNKTTHRFFKVKVDMHSN